MNSDFHKVLVLLKPKYYYNITKLIVVCGVGLISKPIWIEILNVFFPKFNFSIIGKYDWILGALLILLALAYNVYNRLLDLRFVGVERPAFKNVDEDEITDFTSLCQELYPLIMDNEYIFKNTGPNSNDFNTEPLRSDLTLWQKFKIDYIIPNNRAIKKLIKENIKIIPSTFLLDFKQLIIHIDAFKEHSLGTNFDYSEYQFPKQIPKIIIETCYKNALHSKSLKKHMAFLERKLRIIEIKEWFIFGSSIIIPQKANDVDISILCTCNDINEIENLNKYLEKVSFEFKMKTKKLLHITLFKTDNIDKYHQFSLKNPKKRLQNYG